MVGLSVVLEPTRPTQNGTATHNQNPQVISKSMFVTINTQPSSSSPKPRNGQRRHLPDFLHQCFLCKQKLLPGNDIYMYKGDRGFCSVECRCRQMFMDEEESFRAERNCSLANFDPTRDRPAGGFAY